MGPVTTSTDSTPTTTTGIAYRVQGAADGIPVVALHGTPGSRFSATPARDALHALGLRVLTVDRPGYGDTPGSEVRPARELAQDVLDVLMHAGVDGPVGLLAAGGSTPAAVALAALGELTPAAALHVFAAGAIGGEMLAVMTRATRSHTGRATEAAWPTTLAFLAIAASAALRVGAEFAAWNTLIAAAGTGVLVVVLYWLRYVVLKKKY